MSCFTTAEFLLWALRLQHSGPQCGMCSDTGQCSDTSYWGDTYITVSSLRQHRHATVGVCCSWKRAGLDVGGWRGVMAAGSHLISQTNSPEEGLFKFGCVLQPELSPDGGWEAERCSLALLIVGFNFTWHHEGFSAPEPVRGKRTPLVSLLYLWHEVRECASAYFIKTVLFTAGAIVLPPVKPVGPLWKRLMDKYFMSLFLKKTTFFSNF